MKVTLKDGTESEIKLLVPLVGIGFTSITITASDVKDLNKFTDWLHWEVLTRLVK